MTVRDLMNKLATMNPNDNVVIKCNGCGDPWACDGCDVDADFGDFDICLDIDKNNA